MNQLRPSLDVFLRVENIGETQVSRLEDVVAKGEDPTDVTPKVVREVLKPARSPRAKIATAEEIVKFHEAVGLGNIDGRRMAQVGTYLQGALGSLLSGEPLAVPTMPPEIEPLNDGLIVRVAASPEIIEVRHLLWDSLAAFHRLKEVPPEVRLDDELATGVWVTQSTGPATNRLARKVYVELSCDNGILDQHTSISGPVEVEPALSAG
jgi:hypothetical protein